MFCAVAILIPVKTKLKRQTIFFITILIAIVQFVNAQTFPVKFYKGDETVSLLNPQCLHQDGRGVLWMGTAYRLAWYDGSLFINQQLPKVDGQLYVTNIKEDSKHQFWITTFYNGLYKYANNKFYQYLPHII